MPSDPPGSIRMLVAGRTDVGLIREHNEDNFLIVDLGDGAAPAPASAPAAEVPARELRPGERGALVIVCDGMGGAAAGEVASSMAIDTVSSLMRAEQPPAGTLVDPAADARTAFARRLRAAAWEANRRIHDASVRDEARAGMGTTMTSLGVVGGDLVMAQVGDSRAYVLRDHKLVQMTRDQSLVNQLLETGQINEEQARMFEHSNVILQALGVQPEVEVLLSTVALRRGDRVVVCTDGLTGVVADDELLAVLDGTPDVDEASRKLVEMARAAGGPDNITVVAAAFDGDALPAPGPGDALAYKRWYLDEAEPPPAPPPLPSLTDGTSATGWRRHDPAKTFLSLMVMLALALGGMVAGAQLRRSGGVRCRVAAPAGLALRVDGCDVGLRTGAGDVELRLPPGSHRLGLRGPGAPPGERTVEVREGESCRVGFEGAR